MLLQKRTAIKYLSSMLAFTVLLMGLSIPSLAGNYRTLDVTTSSDWVESGALTTEGIVVTESVGNSMTLEEFELLVTNSDMEDYIGICTFEGTGLEQPKANNENKWVDTLVMKFGADKEKSFSISHSSYFTTSTNVHNYKSFYYRDNLASGFTSGNGALVFPCSGVHGSLYTYDFSKVTGSTMNESIKTIAAVVNIHPNSSELVAYFRDFDDNETGYQTVITPSNTETEATNAFVSFTAPEGSYIYKLEIKPPSAWLAFDDFCFVTEARERPAAVPTSVVIEGPSLIDTPSYHTTDTYEYIAKVINQYDEVMVDEVATLSLEENEVATLRDGVLKITHKEPMPEYLTLNAVSETNPDLTATFSIEINDNSPFYNPVHIAHDDGTEYLREDFVRDMHLALEDPDKDVAYLNFDSEDLIESAATWTMPLAKNPDTKFGITNINGSFGRIDTRAEIAGKDGETYGDRMTPSSGDYVTSIVPIHIGENDYVFETGKLGDKRVTAIGMVIISYSNSHLKGENGWNIEVDFSDETTGVYSKDVPKAADGSENTFFGIKAPEGHYITGFKINLPSRTWSYVDDMGFIIDDTDIIPLERDYAKLTFASFENQNPEHITESFANLPTTTSEGCTVSWESSNPAVISNTGQVNTPDTSVDSSIKFKAILSYGALTKSRTFNLYVPSKLDVDWEAIKLPSSTSEDIELPTVGAVFGSEIIWSSDRPQYLNESGSVNRPDGKDKYVILTATIKNSSGEITKEIGISVEGKLRDQTSPGGGGGGGGGGGSSSGDGTIPTPPTTIKPIETNVNLENNDNSVFSDVPESHWAYSAINSLYEKGIINGIGEDAFAPNGKVTREQYLAMLVRAFGLTAENATADFTDVDKSSWYYDSVAIAHSMGICGGYGDGTFGTGKEITREEMAVIAYRCSLNAGIVFDADVEKEWNDNSEISEFAQSAVSALNAKGIINGISENEFSPKTTTTRAQAAVIIERLLGVIPVEKE